MTPEQAEQNQSQAEAKSDQIKDEKAETEYEKLKAKNEEMEKELIRAREQRAEAQRIEAEKVLGGEGGPGIPHKSPKEELEEKARKEAEEIANAFR